VRRVVFETPSPLVVGRGRSQVPVAEEILRVHYADVGVEELSILALAISSFPWLSFVTIPACGI
jgi:hypothetical protein